MIRINRTFSTVTAAMACSLAGGTVAAEAAMHVRIANTQGQGVASRSAPQLAARNGHGAPEGAVVILHCHVWGEAVGARANRLWDLIEYQGRRFYTPDLFTDSPTVANQPVNGIPFCEQPAPPPPPPADQVAANVAAHARSLVGTRFISGRDHATLARFGSNGGWAPGPYGEASGDCYRIASLSWMTVGIRPVRAGSARAAADAYARAGRLRGGVPPTGAMVFYNLTSYGHAGISLGGGQVVSTQGMDNHRLPIRQHAYNGLSAYRGWVDPR